MSRSRKKHGVIKDRGWMHGLYNRKFRRVNKQRIKMGKRPLLMNELIDPWDISDWVYIWVERDMRRRFDEGTHYFTMYYESIDVLRRKYFGK